MASPLRRYASHCGTCLWCGELFRAARSTKRYCGSLCKNRLHWSRRKLKVHHAKIGDRP